MSYSVISVRGGTRSAESPRLCDTCENGVVYRGSTDSQEFVYCDLMRTRVEVRVVECTRYISREQEPLWAMREAAWHITGRTPKERLGFASLIRNPEGDGEGD